MDMQECIGRHAQGSQGVYMYTKDIPHLIGVEVGWWEPQVFVKVNSIDCMW
jgi:hypothetical protein